MPLVILRGLGLATVCEFEWVEKQYSLRARASDTNDAIPVLVLGGMDSVIAGAPSSSGFTFAEGRGSDTPSRVRRLATRCRVPLPGCEIAMPQTHD